MCLKKKKKKSHPWRWSSPNFIPNGFVHCICVHVVFLETFPSFCVCDCGIVVWQCRMWLYCVRGGIVFLQSFLFLSNWVPVVFRDKVVHTESREVLLLLTPTSRKENRGWRRCSSRLVCSWCYFGGNLIRWEPKSCRIKEANSRWHACVLSASVWEKWFNNSPQTKYEQSDKTCLMFAALVSHWSYEVKVAN